MSNQDAIAPLVIFKGVRTDVLGDTALPVPLASAGWMPTLIHYYNSNANQSTARVGIFTGASATGTTVRPSFSLSSMVDRTVVRSLAAASITTLVVPNMVYINCDTVSGVPGSTIDVAIYGYALP